VTLLSPEILSQERHGADKAVLKLRLPGGLLYFQGHFPSSPILPGVTQVDWALRMGRDLFPVKGEFLGMEALKFQQVLQPGDEVELSLEFREDRNALSFRFVSAKGRHSSGLLFFGEGA
jgi:3-hydroxymyristoyl/3-hydroxydecanoyl-(acyl carrier protein) dehydratase